MSNYTIEGYIALSESILKRTGNNPDEEVKPGELLQVLNYMVELNKALIASGLTTAAATAGSEQKSLPGGVNTVSLENLPLSTGAGAVVQGYPLQIGSTLLLPAQTNKIENGIYEVTPEGLKRLEGYDTAASLSRVNVAVQNGDRAGDIFQQPNTLTSDNAEKTFNYVSNQSEALKSLAASLIEEESEEYFDFDGTEDEETGEFTPKLEYVIKELVGNYTLKRIVKRSPSLEKSLKKDIEWKYNPTTGLLTLSASAVSNMRKAEGHEIRLDLATRGTMGLASGFVARVLGGRWMYRFGNETDAQLRDAGEATAIPGIAVVNNDTEEAAAMTGDQPKWVVRKGQENGWKAFNPPHKENVFTHTPKV